MILSLWLFCLLGLVWFLIKSNNAWGKQATNRSFLATNGNFLATKETNCENNMLDSPQYFQKNTKPGCLALELALDQFSLQEVLYCQWWAPSAALWLQRNLPLHVWERGSFLERHHFLLKQSAHTQQRLISVGCDRRSVATGLLHYSLGNTQFNRTGR